MIELQQVTYQYPRATGPALERLSLTIPAGSFTLVVGASGSGKSTFVRCLNGLVPHFSGGEISGTIRVGGLDPVLLGPEGMSALVGCVFQDPESQAVMDSVEDEIAFALEHTGMGRQEMRMRVEETLDLLDLAPLRARRLETLSGGERQRVAIAAAIALRPAILVLDEPTSQLDPQSAEDVLQALVRLNGDLGLTIVLAEHRMERVLAYVDQIIFLSDAAGALVGPPESVLQAIALTPPLVTIAKELGWSPLPLTIKAGLRHSARYRAPIPQQIQPQAAPDPFIELRGIAASYAGRAALSGVSLSVAPGEIVALLGRNGTGKTTLLKCIVGLHRPTSGQVLIGGRDSAGVGVAARCRLVGYLPQNPSALLFAETVREELEITLRNHAIDDPARVDQLLGQLQLSQKAGAYPRSLSVGERQRVALGAIMAPALQALLLDEPTRGLDYIAKRGLAELLRSWRADGRAILLVSHDVEFIAELADRVVIMGRGEVIASGAPAEVLGASPLFAPQVARLFPGTGWITAGAALRGLGAAAERGAP